jgi:hypothetical protein
MGVPLKLVRKTLVGSDQRWIGSELGTRSNRSATVDLSLFNFASTFTDKLIPSGVVLGKVTATGKYGPYSDAAGNGLEVARGHLFTDVDVMEAIEAAGSTTLSGSVLVPLFIHGIVIEASLPTNHGLDTAAKTDLKFVQYV